MKQLQLGTLLALAATTLSAATDVKPSGWTPPSETREWRMTNSFAVGYRSDRQRLFQPSYKAYLNNFNTMTMEYEMLFSWERLLLKLSADYGWLIHGNLSFKGLSSPFQGAQQNFNTFSVSSGYSVKVLPEIGARIPFWHIACRKGCFAFTPALGYTYNHFNAYPMGRNTATTAGATGFTALEFSRPIQQDWYGPTVEGRVGFSWMDQWHFDIFYQYLHLNFRQTFSQTVSNFYTNGAGTINTSLIRYSSKGNTLRTQLGGADLSYRSPNHWQLGAHFEGSATWSNTSRTLVRTTRDTFLPAVSQTKTAIKEQLSAHWTRYSINFYGSYWF